MSYTEKCATGFCKGGKERVVERGDLHAIQMVDSSDSPALTISRRSSMLLLVRHSP